MMAATEIARIFVSCPFNKFSHVKLSVPFITLLNSFGCYGCHVNESQHMKHELSEVTNHFHAKS